jgi:hypothetical protein
MLILAVAAAGAAGLLLAASACAPAAGVPAPAPGAAGTPQAPRPGGPVRVQGGTTTITTTQGSPHGQGLGSLLIENGIMPGGPGS